MSTRFATNALIALLGGLIVVLSKGLSSVAGVEWSAFGIAIGIVAISALAQLDARRGIVQRLLDAGLIAIAGTLIGVSVFYAGATLTWVAFALALGLVGAAFAGLTMHEIETWRAVHNLGELHWLHPLGLGERRHAAPSEQVA